MATGSMSVAVILMIFVHKDLSVLKYEPLDLS
ncbi:MAG: hypothetical protein USCGTAYLOR_00527 [Chromatiales bacterium USCg_Taylor]|nr:MAG: hypothetical protein USCGTAYLOR_00527 [Chromatiales bacterium USCg_Taylor]